jgi:hypothetical protein
MRESGNEEIQYNKSMQIVTNLVKLDLVGLDGNAFSLMGAFSKAARRQKTSSEEINAVIKECMSGDYDNLLCVLMNNTTN